MLLHYYTLCHVAREIDTLSGSFLTECFTQERNTIHCVFERGRETRVLEVHLDSRHGAIFLRPEFHRARKNTLDLFPELIGRTLTRAEVMPQERIIRLYFPPYTLYLTFFAGWNDDDSGASAPVNALLTLPIVSESPMVQESLIQHPSEEPSSRIIAAFRSPQHLVGTPLRLKHHSRIKFQDFPGETTLEKALATCDIGLGSVYAREAIARIPSEIGLNGTETMASAVVQKNMQIVESQGRSVYEMCLGATTFFVLRDERNKLLFSLLRPSDSAVKIEGEYASLSEALRQTVQMRHREERFSTLQASAEARLQAVLAKAKRALEAIGRDSEGAKRSQERQLWAELLLSQPNVQQKGLETISLQNWDEEIIVIRLNPALSLRENAEEYFHKAAAARLTVKKREQRFGQQEQIIYRANEALVRLGSITTERELEKYMHSIGQKDGKIRMNHDANTAQHQKTTRFREFPLDDEHTLYVGKTAADNDELTLRFAKPNDYWFHARGVPGSHAVLRSPSKDKKPPKNIIEQAAAIAAYFSKARNAKMSPVAYTQKKYIRKPKGSAVGAVVLEREEVLMVRPRVPVGLVGAENDD